MLSVLARNACVELISVQILREGTCQIYRANYSINMIRYVIFLHSVRINAVKIQLSVLHGLSHIT